MCEIHRTWLFVAVFQVNPSCPPLGQSILGNEVFLMQIKLNKQTEKIRSSSIFPNSVPLQIFANSFCDACERYGVSLLPSLAWGRGGVCRSCKALDCTLCCNRLGCILPLHSYWGRNWGRWLEVGRGEEEGCSRSVGNLADSRCRSRKERRLMGKEWGTRVGLAPCNMLQ